VTVIAGELGEAAGWRGGRDQHDGQHNNQQSHHCHRHTCNKRAQCKCLNTLPGGQTLRASGVALSSKDRDIYLIQLQMGFTRLQDYYSKTQ
jgi:hypothetical protein